MRRNAVRSITQYLTIVALALCIGAPATAFAQDMPSVSVQDEIFIPGQAEILAGDTLTWTQDGAEQHTITADDGSFDSGIINPGDTFAFTFDASGTYPYYCQIHGAPGGIGMAGTVIVD
jgi:plastocyanin